MGTKTKTKMRPSRLKMGLVFITGILFFPGVVSSAGQLEELFEKGEAAYQNGDYKTALDYYEQVVTLNPDFVPVYNSLGLVYLGMDYPIADTAWFFKTALKMDPRNAAAHTNLCKAYNQAGEVDQAEKACLNALTVDANNMAVQLTLAWVYLRKAQARDAVRYFDMVAPHVKNAMVYYGQGLAYAMNGDYALTLDVITTLRGMNRDELAAQLEQMVRASSPVVPVLPPPELTGPDLGAPVAESTLIKAQPEEDVPVAEDEQQGLGFMKVRLRGKIEDTEDPAGKIHPGTIEADKAASATGRYVPSNYNVNPDEYSRDSSALERIQRLRQFRSGAGTGQAY